MSTPNTPEYGIREPYRDAIIDYLDPIYREDEAPNFMKIVYDVAPDFGVSSTGYRTAEYKMFHLLMSLSIHDLIEIDERVVVLPPLRHSSPHGNIMYRYALAGRV